MFTINQKTKDNSMHTSNLFSTIMIIMMQNSAKILDLDAVEATTTNVQEKKIMKRSVASVCKVFKTFKWIIGATKYQLVLMRNQDSFDEFVQASFSAWGNLVPNQSKQATSDLSWNHQGIMNDLGEFGLPFCQFCHDCVKLVESISTL